MQPIIGLLYIATGLLCDFVFVLFVGAMVNIARPELSLNSLLPPLFGIGPALLVLTGVMDLAGKKPHRGGVTLISTVIVVGALAAWSIPRIGLRESLMLLVLPALGSYVIASLLLVAIKTRWVTALVGVILSAPFFFYGAGTFAFDFFTGKAEYASSDAWIFLPCAALAVSFLAALTTRYK